MVRKDAVDDMQFSLTRHFRRGGHNRTQNGSEEQHLSLSTQMHFLERKLDEVERADAVGHLARCHSCREMLKQTHRVMQDALTEHDHLRWPIILAHLAGVLVEEAAREVRDHSAACTACGQKLAEASRRFDRALAPLRRYGLTTWEAVLASVRWTEEAQDLAGHLASDAALPIPRYDDSPMHGPAFGAAGAFGDRLIVRVVEEGQAAGIQWKIEEDSEARRRLKIEADTAWLEAHGLSAEGGVVQTLARTTREWKPVFETIPVALCPLGPEAYGVTALPVGAALSADSSGQVAFSPLEPEYQIPEMAATLHEARLLNEREDEQAQPVWSAFVERLPADTRAALDSLDL